MLDGVAFITGAASGIGQATAWSFHRKGVRRFVLVDLGDLGDTMAKLPGAEVINVTADVSSEADVKNAIELGVQKWGRIDYAANCAGIGGFLGKLVDTGIDDWDRTLRVNARGMFICVREQLKQMSKQEPLALDQDLNPKRAQRGAIVNVASVLGLRGRVDVGAYGASKHAVVCLAKTACLEHGKDRIRINTVAPGIIESPMTRGGHLLEEDSRQEMTPMTRAGLPEEVADVITFLCSPEASFVNGAVWSVDGGIGAH